MTTALAAFREYHALRAFLDRAAKYPTADKPALARELTAAREGLDAARAAWSAGLPAPALRLALDAWTSMMIVARKATDTKEAPLFEVLAGLPLAEDAIQEIVRMEAARQDSATPSTTTEVTTADVERFPQLTRAIERVATAVQPYASSIADVRRLRLVRLARSACVAVVVLAVLIFFVQAQFRTRATASARYDADHDAPNVLDAHPDSEWLLPDGAGGWIDLSLSPSRTVDRVRIINARNFPHKDRATKDFRIEIYRKGALLKSVEGSFPTFEAKPTWTTIEVGHVTGVDQVRIVVTSWHLTGGGFGEIRID